MKPTVREVFAARLKALRKQRGVSGERVANAARIGLSTYRQYEQGCYLPRADILVDLADYFGVSIDYLLGRAALEKQLPKKISYSDCDCPICNEHIDEAYADGLWDLAAKILCIFGVDTEIVPQDDVYDFLRSWIKSQPYCPRCGQRMDWSDNDA